MKNDTRKVINIVNFVRGVEPRDPKIDLFLPVEQELELNKKYGFPNTFLLQYDAMLRPDFQELFLTRRDGNTELGVWIEIVRPLTEAVGIEWRGRPGYDWDWHINPGFLMAYTQKQRELLADEIMRKFRELFGEYPKSVGSWLLDSYTMDYMSRKYNIEAFAVCREQFAVDAYTLWGGYYNQGYYASKFNMLCPASSPETQIPAPVFRMLGIDPIYGYSENTTLYPQESGHGCPTLEPVWYTGREPHCIDWMLDCNFKEECLNFAYVQLGQENSFGWKDIVKGLPTQFEKVQKLVSDGSVTVEKLCDTGRWFKNRFAATPATSLIASTDRESNGLRSVWYNCKNYRANVVLYGNELYFRDIYMFNDAYREKYYKTPCTDWQATYDNLPVVDGRLWSSDSVVAKLAFECPMKEISSERIGDSELTVTAFCRDGEKIRIELTEAGIDIFTEKSQRLSFRRGTDYGTEIDIESDTLKLRHNGFSYSVPVSGELIPAENGYDIVTVGGKAGLSMKNKE